MASLKETLQADLTSAMRNKDETRKTTLRMLISAVRNAEIRTPPAGATDAQLEEMAKLPPLSLSDDEVLAVIQTGLAQMILQSRFLKCEKLQTGKNLFT